MRALFSTAILIAALVISGCHDNETEYSGEMPNGFEGCTTAVIKINGSPLNVFRCPSSEVKTALIDKNSIKNNEETDYTQASQASYENDKDRVRIENDKDRVRIKTPKDDKLTDAVSVNGIIYRVNNDLTEIMVDAKTERRLTDSISINGIEYRREQPKENDNSPL